MIDWSQRENDLLVSINFKATLSGLCANNTMASEMEMCQQTKHPLLKLI